MFCRYVLFEGTEDLSQRLKATFENRSHYKPNYNTAPGGKMPVVSQNASGQRIIDRFNWGLLPFWATEEIDAENSAYVRAETLGDKSKFRPYFANRRCLIPANGYYEWRDTQGELAPYYNFSAQNTLFAMAGLYSKWESPSGKLIPTFCLITSPGKESNNRVPAILPQEVWNSWLDPTNLNTDNLQEMLFKPPVSKFRRHPVSRKVDNLNNNNPELILPLKINEHI